MPKNNRGSGLLLGHWGERGLIQWLLPRLRRQPERFFVPPGDDAAVLRSASRPVLSIDGLVDGTHFRMDWQKRVNAAGLSLGRALGWKLMGSSLSDLATMGRVSDRWAMIYVGAPGHLPASFLKDFFLGLQDVARKHNCALAGGDTVRSKTLNLVAAVGGSLQSPRALTRGGCLPGDLIAVTGPVGDAEVGLDVLRGRIRLPGPQARGFVRRFFDVRPQFQFGALLARSPGVTSLLDLSDSLVESVDLLAGAARLGFAVDVDKLPRSEMFRSLGLGRRYRFSGGEDYTLLFTVPPRHVRRLRAAVPFRVIGSMSRKGGARIWTSNGSPIQPKNAFHHFL